MKRIKYGREPVLHTHRYIVQVGGCPGKHWKWKVHYCMNLDEVKLLREDAPKGSVIEVYEAHHNFREAWRK